MKITSLLATGMGVLLSLIVVSGEVAELQRQVRERQGTRKRR